MAKNTLVRLKHAYYWLDPKSGLIYWRKTIKGRRIKKSTGTTKITEAKRIIEEFELSLTSSDFTKDRREKLGIKTPRLETIWSDLMDERAPKSADTTIQGYGVSWRVKMSPFWGEKHVSDMTEKNVKSFEAWFMKEFPTMVFFNTGKHLRMLINYMVREGYLQKKLEVSNLDKEVINAKYKKKKPYRIYTEMEQENLLEAATNLETRVCLVAYFDTGMRKMELLSRAWDNVDFKKNVFNTWSQKNKQWREVPMSPRLKSALREHQKVSLDSKYIFPAKRNLETHVASQVFDKQWVATKRLAGIRGRARVHDIRHTFATKTSEDGWPIKVACEVLDMSVDVYMRIYVHTNEKDKFTWMNRSFNQ
jgi:integrase